MAAIDKLQTIADFNALPESLKSVIRSTDSNPRNLRHVANRNKAERKTLLQGECVKAVETGHITKRLAIEILTANKAYGKDGKAAIASIKE